MSEEVERGVIEIEYSLWKNYEDDYSVTYDWTTSDGDVSEKFPTMTEAMLDLKRRKG